MCLLMRPYLEFYCFSFPSLAILGKMHHTADGQSDRHCIYLLSLKIIQITLKREMRYQDEIAFDNPMDPTMSHLGHTIKSPTLTLWIPYYGYYLVGKSQML